MATSPSTPILGLLLNQKKSHNHKKFNDESQFSFPHKRIYLAGELHRRLPEMSSLLSPSQGYRRGFPLTIHEQLDMAAQTVENIADAVEKVAERVEHAAEELEESLPEGRLKEVVHFVEHLAEETAEEADKIGDLMDKVEEIDDKLEEFLDKQFKRTDKA
ncbi:hypothetical protein AAHA92_15872 [Salvia divinorum]|uniref:Uncharacterized protein n=1 Tax=Salvia divinorum TaxID=28513 RepID=A0ABD1GTQ6_SALDI